jgi:hypothetical protein
VWPWILVILETTYWPRPQTGRRKLVAMPPAIRWDRG